MLKNLLRIRYKYIFNNGAKSLHQKSSFTSVEVRQSFINFYRDKYKHVAYPSSKVWNSEDPTLLFVNAGMNQFKPIFLGQKQLDGELLKYKRAVNSQRCIRAGGKHNDLNDVGHDLCHHTFFEMLGSWSFGDYFKKETCIMAWKLLTEVYNLDKNRLYVTYFGGCDKSRLQPDLETQNIWQAIGIPPERILAFGPKENFWEMGDVGPCGPCTEIHYDQVGDGRFVPDLVNKNGSDVVEVWNLVFMQYNRLPCKSLEKLPNSYVDCGMGLERITAILQGKKSNYDTDLFTPIIKAIEKICECPPYKGKVGLEDVNGIDATFRIISDHVRMLTAAIADGILPGTQDRHLIVRQVLHRALQSGYDVLNSPPGFLCQLIPTVVKSLENAIPDLTEKEDQIISIVSDAEKDYLQTLKTCKIIVRQTVEKMSKEDIKFPDNVARHLLYHYGYPLNNLKFEIELHNKVLNELQLTRDQHLQSHQVKSNTMTHIFKSIEHMNFTPTTLITPKLEKTASGQINVGSNYARILVFLTKSGNVLERYSSDVWYILLDKSNIPKINNNTKNNIGVIAINKKEFAIKKVLAFKGCLFYEIQSKTPELLLQAKIGDEVEIIPNTEFILSQQRSKQTLKLMKNSLKKVVDQPLILDCRADSDEIKMEISGVLPTDKLILFENLVKNFISNTDSTKSMDPYLTKIGQFVITSSKLQGKSRTILRCKTGPLALQVLKDTAQIKNTTESTLEDQTHSIDKDSDKQYLKTLGILLNDLNKSTISHVVKLQLKNLIQTKLNDFKLSRKQKVKL